MNKKYSEERRIEKQINRNRKVASSSDFKQMDIFMYKHKLNANLKPC